MRSYSQTSLCIFLSGAKEGDSCQNPAGYGNLSPVLCFYMSFKVASDLGSPKLRTMGLGFLDFIFFFNKYSKPAASIQIAVRNIQYLWKTPDISFLMLRTQNSKNLDQNDFSRLVSIRECCRSQKTLVAGSQSTHTAKAWKGYKVINLSVKNNSCFMPSTSPEDICIAHL